MTDGRVKTAIVLHAKDDVAILALPVAAGECVLTQGARAGTVLFSRHALPAGHKIALTDLALGAHVRKYGEVIGRLTAAVAAGDHVHIHNLVSLRATDEKQRECAEPRDL
jgi:altronate hydrolase/altronate dehydratase small subunit